MFLYIAEHGSYVSRCNQIFVLIFYLLLYYIIIFSVTAAEVAEDSSLLAIGFSDSGIKVWSLVPQKLRLMKTGEQLSEVKQESGRT